MKRNFILALTGASGATYAVRLLEVMIAAGCDVHDPLSCPAGSRCVHLEAERTTGRETTGCLPSCSAVSPRGIPWTRNCGRAACRCREFLRSAGAWESTRISAASACVRKC